LQQFSIKNSVTYQIFNLASRGGEHHKQSVRGSGERKRLRATHLEIILWQKHLQQSTEINSKHRHIPQATTTPPAVISSHTIKT